jgi:hypothetical protein
MKLRHYELICFIIILFLGYEYAIFNGRLLHSQSIIKLLFPIFSSRKYIFNSNPTAGYPLSYFLGCLGFGLMVIMNLYTVRKRFQPFRQYGKLQAWLDFHIFCGILGPILIVFHANFKVTGLVAISFWSMVIAGSSGVLGRYFYMQTLKQSVDVKRYSKFLKEQFVEVHRLKFTDQKFDEIFAHANRAAGIREGVTNPVLIFILSVIADIRLKFSHPGESFGLNDIESEVLKVIGVENRRDALLGPFNQLLGYWHAFHLPFAFIMYILAVIHILTALILVVRH